MPRGGRRPGAGRNALPFKDRIAIGADAENMMRRHSRAKAEKKIDARVLVERAARIQATIGQRSFYSIESKRRELETRTQKVFGKRGRLVSQPIRRVYGAREAIIKEVAQLHRVTPRMVVTCLVEYRAFMREFHAMNYKPNSGS